LVFTPANSDTPAADNVAAARSWRNRATGALVAEVASALRSSIKVVRLGIIRYRRPWPAELPVAQRENTREGFAGFSIVPCAQFVLDGDGPLHPAGRRRLRANGSNNAVDEVAEISYV
jgi:hypothetical protein